MTPWHSRSPEYAIATHILRDATLDRPARIGSLGAWIQESATLQAPSALPDLDGHRSFVPEHFRPFHTQILTDVKELKALQEMQEMQEMTTARLLMLGVGQQNLGLISGESGNPRRDPANALIADNQGAEVMGLGFSSNTIAVKRRRDEEGSDLATQDGSSECESQCSYNSLC